MVSTNSFEVMRLVESVLLPPPAPHPANRRPDTETNWTSLSTRALTKFLDHFNYSTCRNYYDSATVFGGNYIVGMRWFASFREPDCPGGRRQNI